MARIRSVHPELCTDETLSDLSAEVERTFVRLWPHLDDEGRVVDNPRLLKAALYPLIDGISAADVDRDLWALAEAGLVIRYRVDGRDYVAVKPDPWRRYQKPRHRVASKLPAHDSDTAEVRPTPVRHASDEPAHTPLDGAQNDRKSTGDEVRQTSDIGPSRHASDIGPTTHATEGRGEEGSRRVVGVGDGDGLAAAGSSHPRAREPAAAAVDNVAHTDTEHRQTLIDNAAHILAERRATHRPDVGPGWIRSAATGIAKDHHQRAHEHLARLPASSPEPTPEQLADFLEPPPRSPPAGPAKPAHIAALEETQTAAQARLQRHTRQHRGERCRPCDGTGWTTQPDGTAAACPPCDGTGTAPPTDTQPEPPPPPDIVHNALTTARHATRHPHQEPGKP